MQALSQLSYGPTGWKARNCRGGFRVRQQDFFNDPKRVRWRHRFDRRCAILIRNARAGYGARVHVRRERGEAALHRTGCAPLACRKQAGCRLIDRARDCRNGCRGAGPKHRSCCHALCGRHALGHAPSGQVHGWRESMSSLAIGRSRPARIAGGSSAPSGAASST